MPIAAIDDRRRVTSAIQLASASTGVDFGYLYAQAKIESGLNPDARAPTSSARGLYQFTSGTWLDTVRRHGAEHGLAWAADALKAGADPATRAAILDLRRDPDAAARMAGAFAADNRTRLEAGLGRAVTATDLYMAHFLGSSGALRFLRARDADPLAAAASVAPAAAHANRAVFFTAGGTPRSLAAIYDRFTAKLGGSSLPPAGNAAPVRWPQLAATSPTPLAHPAAARLAYLLLAELGA